MKILVIGNRIPWPIRDGGAMASYQLLKGYAEAGAELCFVVLNTAKHHLPTDEIQQAFPFCETIALEHNANLSAVSALINLFKSESYFLARYHSQQALSVLQSKADWADWVQVEGLYSMPLARALKQSNPAVRLVYRAHNVEYEIWSRLAQSGVHWLKKCYLKLQVNRLKKEEQLAWKQVDARLPISSDDAEVMSQAAPEVPQYTLLPGVQVQALDPIHIAPDALCHVGSMEWMANREALNWFLQYVWPKVLAMHEQARFHIAGKGLSKKDPAYFQLGVVNHGEVEDASAFMREHGILVVPLRAGSGIRMKTLEALSLGVPVVSTTVGAQGLSIKPGQEICIADQAQSMAEALVDLMKDRKKAIQLAENGRFAAMEKYQIGPNIQGALGFLSSLS